MASADCWLAMCGICGVASFGDGSREDDDIASVTGVLHALSHRGPDRSSLVVRPGAAFAAARLSIRAPQAVPQPFVDRGSGILFVCNGEIDNHRELRMWLEKRGSSPDPRYGDIGVVPGLYQELGEVFVQHLVGTFALALWDPRERLLLLARDRAGEKPLFFVHSPGERKVTFASELGAIVRDPRLWLSVNRDAISWYLSRGCFPAPMTPIAGVEKVGAGELILIRPEGKLCRTYWRWDTRAAKDQLSEDALLSALRQAVQRQTDVDVECGVFLSGGIDSSLVAAVFRENCPTQTIKAYSLRFREDSFDEGDFARRVAESLQLDYRPVWAEPELIPGLLARAVSRIGEPIADPAFLPQCLLASHAANDVRVALVGEGADELFGGYPTYLGASLADSYRHIPGWGRRLIESCAGRWADSDEKVPLSVLVRKFVEHAGLPAGLRHLAWTANASAQQMAWLGLRSPVLDMDIRATSFGEILDSLQLWDFETSLAEGLLTKTDRSGMLFGLEVRAPFLDPGVMEIAARLHPRWKVGRGRTKRLLKRAARAYLPSSIVDRRKRGLSVPLVQWLWGPLREWAWARLLGGALAEVGIDESAIRGMLLDQSGRRSDCCRPLWSLLVLSEWLEWFREVRGTRPRNDVEECRV